MKSPEYKNLFLTEVDCEDRLRDVDPAYVEALASSILEHGQQTPIPVRKAEGGYKLLAGLHRISALKYLEKQTGHFQIHEAMSDEDARLFEIDENLIRHELNPLDRAVFLAERKSIYEKMYPETKAGVAGGKARQGSTNETLSFSKDTAEKLGLGKRAIERAVRIATKISPELRQQLTDAGYIKEGELYNLTKHDPSEQQKIIHVILDKGNPASNVKAAVLCLSGDSPAPLSDDEKQFNKLMDAWSRCGGPARQKFSDWLFLEASS